MNFIYPEFLWALLILLIPIIIHLFNFKRYKTFYFSSLSFIKEVDQRTKSTQRLKHFLVLLSRVLAFTCLVFAFAQPYFPDGNSESVTKKNILAFYIDNSFSMQARGAEGELLSQARENVRGMIEKAPLDAQFMLATNEMSGSEERLLSKIEALEKLDGIDFSPITRTNSEIITWQSNRLKEDDISQSNALVQCVYLSDFQSVNTGDVSKIELDHVSFFPIQLKPESSDNIFIDSVWYTSPVHKVDGKNELNIRIVNNSDKQLENVELNINIADYNKTIYVQLPANESSTTQLTYTDKTTGIKSGKVHILDKHVRFDDYFYLSYEVRKNVNVLILDGENAVSNIQTVLGLDDFYKVTEQKLSAFTKDDFQSQDLVIVNGANDLSPGVVNLLEDFANAGGSLALFPGKDIQVQAWNSLLKRLDLASIGRKISSGNRISSIQYNDPFFDGVFASKPEKLQLPSVKTTYEAIVTGNVLSKELVQLQNGLPLLSYGEKNGKAFIFYSSLHPDWGNITSDALFSSIVLKVGELSQRSQPNFLIIGEDSRYPIYTAVNDEQSIKVANEQFEFIPQLHQSSGVNYLSLNLLDGIDQLRAGTFDVLSDGKIGALSLNYNRDESNLESIDEASILDFFEGIGAKNVVFNQIGKDSQISTIDIDKPFSYWKICIVLTLIFVLIEMVLVRYLK